MALRAGVSVGTLYQYYPDKSALLQAALKRHLDEVTEVVERVCREQEGKTLALMATALVTSFLESKMRNSKMGDGENDRAGDRDMKARLQPG